MTGSRLCAETPATFMADSTITAIKYLDRHLSSSKPLDVGLQMVPALENIAIILTPPPHATSDQ